MRTIISNNIEVTDYSIPLYNWCEQNLVITNPMWDQLVKMGKEDTIRRKHIPKELKLYIKKPDRLIIPFGCLWAIWDYIKNSPFQTKFNDVNDLSIKNTPCPLKLYDYQEDAIREILANKGGILSSGCGSGKTITGIEIIHRIGKKALWIVHTKDLLKQAAKNMKELYPNLEIGYITEGKVDIGRDVTISTVQTLDKINSNIYAEEFGTVVVDECHHVSGSPTYSKMFQRVVDSIPARWKVGLSATVFRNDTLTKTMFTTLGVNKSKEFAPAYEVTRDRINTLTAEHIGIEVDTDFSYDTLNEDGTINYNALIDYLSENEYRNETIIDNVMKCNEEGRKQALLCLRVAHCELLYEKLKEKGLRVELITGKTAAKKREAALNETDNWDVIVSTISLFKEGINIKALDSVHLCSPAKDKSAVIQACGRCERVMDGKKEPKFFDYIDIKFPYCVSAYKKRKSYLKNRG